MKYVTGSIKTELSIGNLRLWFSCWDIVLYADWRSSLSWPWRKVMYNIAAWIIARVIITGQRSLHYVTVSWPTDLLSATSYPGQL